MKEILRSKGIICFFIIVFCIGCFSSKPTNSMEGSNIDNDLIFININNS